jgi:hypothetical protein
LSLQDPSSIPFIVGSVTKDKSRDCARPRLFLNRKTMTAKTTLLIIARPDASRLR